MRPAAMFAAAFALSLTLGPALSVADSGGKDDTGTCPRGEVYDSRSGRCVKQGSALPDKVLNDYAAALSKAGRYDEALATLDLLRTPIRRRRSIIAAMPRASSVGSMRGSIITGDRSRSIRVTRWSASISARPLSSKATWAAPRRSCRRSRGYAAPIARNTSISPRLSPTRPRSRKRPCGEDAARLG